MARLRPLTLWPLLLAAACSSGTADDDSCNPDDADGVVGGTTTVLLSVNEDGYAVGGVDSGSTQPNIAVQNSSTVKLTITNTGTKPHGFLIACVPTGLPASCAQESCFPDDANVPVIDPGDSVTVTFTTPAVEGAYTFTSDAAGDEDLVGQFVLT
jgi:hypothetical protein